MKAQTWRYAASELPAAERDHRKRQLQATAETTTPSLVMIIAHTLGCSLLDCSLLACFFVPASLLALCLFAGLFFAGLDVLTYFLVIVYKVERLSVQT